MARKEKLSYVLCSLFLTAAILVCGPLAFSQATAPAAPAQNQIPPDQLAAWEQLTPYQKSQLERTYNDWAFLAKFREADALLPPAAPGETRVVFMGDSITEGWGMKATATSPARGEFFPGKPYINRGISGQTTPQMLVRFRQDVILLKPKVVVLLAGTNDIAENTGKETLRGDWQQYRVDERDCPGEWHSCCLVLRIAGKRFSLAQRAGACSEN